MLIVLYFLSLMVEPQATKAQDKTIAAKVAELGNNRFRVREEAAKVLIEIGPIAKESLRRGANNADEEIACRCKAVLSQIVEQEAASLWPLPCIDAIWYNVESKGYRCDQAKHGHQSAILDKTGRDDHPWESYRWATHTYIRELLADGASPDGLRVWLAILHHKDSVFFGAANAALAVNWKDYLRNK